MPPSTTPLAGITVHLNIIQAKGLVEKDKNWRGNGSSDPFVRIFVNGKKYGYTKTVQKTVDRVWDERITINIGADEAYKLLSSPSPIELHIYDKDKLTFSDPMGLVTIPLDIRDDNPIWYKVGPGTGTKVQCDNATGEMQVACTVHARPYLALERGSFHPLACSAVQLSVQWEHADNSGSNNKKDLDISCAAVSCDGSVRLDSCVYFGNLWNEHASIRLLGDSRNGFPEIIACRLTSVPSHILALYFVVSACAADQTLGSGLQSLEARLVDATTGFGICRWHQAEFGSATSAFLLRLARDPSGSEKKWYLTSMGDGDDQAHDFGALIPRIQCYTRDLLPSLSIDPFSRTAVMRKDGIIRIRDYCETIPETVTFGLRRDSSYGSAE